MRLCDEKDSLHGRVFFCEKNAVRIASQINLEIFLTHNHTFPGHEKSPPAMK